MYFNPGETFRGSKGARFPLSFNATKISVFLTDLQSVALDAVLGLPCLLQHISMCPCIPVLLEATQEASPGPLKGSVSAQKALQGHETEKREFLGGWYFPHEGTFICSADH